MTTKSLSVLLIVPRYLRRETPWYHYWFPLGLAYVSSAMKKAGHEVDCLNLNHLFGPTEQLIQDALSAKQYKAVATGGMAIHFHGIKSVLDSVKATGNHLVTICGGAMIISEPEMIFSSLAPTYGVLGEGEETVIDLLANLETPAMLHQVPGLIFRDAQGKIRVTPSRPLTMDINALPYPDLDGLGYREQLSHSICNDTPWSSFYDAARSYSLMGSRGCPFNCTFCWHYSSYRKRTIDNIIAELASQIPKWRINNVILFDDCFSVTKERIYEFCDKFILLRHTIPWDVGFVCQLRVRGVDRDLLMKLKSAGCHTISFGFESYSEDVLRSMKKGIQPQEIDAALRATLDSNLLLQANFIFGDVAETLETARTTLAYWRDHCQGQVQLYYIQPYPGSELYRYCVERGIIPNKLEFIKTRIEEENRINMSQTMTDREYKTMCYEIDSYKSKHASRAFAHIVTSYGVREGLHSIRLKCPFCREKVVYNNVLLDKSPFNEVYRNTFGGMVYQTTLACRRCSKRIEVVCSGNLLQYILTRFDIWLKLHKLIYRSWLRLSRLVVNKRV